jgi:phosphate transport system protein
MPNEDHILSIFDHALKEIKTKTIEMGAGAQRNVKNAMHGLMHRDKDICNQTIADDDDEDRLQIEIDRLGMNIIVKFHPVASDLRMVISSMKTAANLERISDQAVSIAKNARKIMKAPELADLADIEGLHLTASGMLAEAMTAYETGNTELALKVVGRDPEIKRAHKSTSRKFSKKLEGKSDSCRQYLDLIFICRWLERVGSLSVNIAEDVIFEETSTDIRHGGELPEKLLD